MDSYQRRIYIYFALFIFALIIFFIRDFLVLIALAFVTVTVFNPVYKFFVKKTNKRITLSVTGTLTVIFLSVIIPFTIVLASSIAQANVLLRDLEEVFTVDENNPNDTDFVDTLVEQANSGIGLFSFIDYEVQREDVNDFGSRILTGAINLIFGNITRIGTSALNFIALLFIYGALVATIFPNQKKIMKTIKNISPFNNDINNLFIRKTTLMADSMVKGTLIIGIIQGSVSAFFLWITGVPYIFFILLILIFFSSIPILGAGLIVVPIGFLQIITGDVWEGLFVWATFGVISSNIDNVLRPMLVSREARIPAALVLIGVFAGIGFFGIWGVVYGPTIMIIGLTTLEIYNTHFNPKLVHKHNYKYDLESAGSRFATKYLNREEATTIEGKIVIPLKHGDNNSRTQQNDTHVQKKIKQKNKAKRENEKNKNDKKN